jgi:hypothetical protein
VRMTRAVRIIPATSDNLTPQETTNQGAPDIGADGGD